MNGLRYTPVQEPFLAIYLILNNSDFWKNLQSLPCTHCDNEFSEKLVAGRGANQECTALSHQDLTGAISYA
ncbi:hypothetical protein ACVWV0_001031 [Ewingella americana]|jgi:hypothetical protein